MAADGAGNFVVAWQSYLQDGPYYGIFGQRYDSSGAPVGSEFQLNTWTTNGQRRPAVAADGAGNFVVVWDSLAQDGAQYGVFAARSVEALAQTGTLILEKQTDPNDPNTVFTFDTSSIDPNDPNSPDTTELRDDEQATFAGIVPGTYRIDETIIPGYELELVDCTVDTGSDDTVWDPNDPNDATGADIVVNAGQTVTCVFNNRRFDATLDVTKTTSPTELSAGETVTWTVTITNDGPDPAEAVTLVDDLPDGVAFLSATPSQGTCDESGGVVTCDLLTIIPDQTVTVVIEAEVRVVGEIVNEVTVTGNSGFANGSATAPAVLSAATDVPMDDPWMLALLVIALALASAIVLRR
ncbi:MAG TPA: DUF11 domain-containing protein [Thermoanaerobaculia bacterium]|nr:DUF11 domain-containing protein [Thermoanaerobaculia bacterium]